MSAARKRGLGRGLDALLGAEGGTRMLPLGDLKPNRMQPRSLFDEGGLEELAQSIRTQGVVQPLIVAPRSDGSYTIIAGERRFRAARLAGLEQVPVVVREVADERELLELALVENLQRADLNPLEEAEAYQELGARFNLSHEEIGGRVGKSRAAISNALRLLRLPPEVHDLLRDGRLTAGQARPLLAIAEPATQVELAERAVSESLSARELERLSGQQRKRKGRKGQRPKRSVDTNTVAAEERLAKRLQTKVEIRRRGKSGDIRIYFHNEESLMRIFDLLMKRGG
ncbi:MAG TPA: ParB/RepB/Spo0J family partition protein [Thermoanaerobaculia bacterium]|nr:ParB/RepB/Spo0J family partition protein [Thermoanaerobaculia bacterium]